MTAPNRICRIPRLLLALVLVAPCVAADKAEPGNRVSDKGLFRARYRIDDPSFCYASACVDVDNDGQRDLFFSSRRTKELTRLRAADGTVEWSRPFPGDQQSICAFDVDGDGTFEILYTTSNPGRLNLVDRHGAVVRHWEATDHKLGNSPLILDADGDGELDAIFGTRSESLIRLRLRDFNELARRRNWAQCGCHTTAMDVDRDGRWDLFAGSGDDFGFKGVLHRFDPVTLASVWSVDTNDNASSADPVLVDLDGDGQVEILKSVDNYKGDDNHERLAAYRTDGTKLWEVAGIAEEDSPNAADLDGDGRIEIVGMTFGGEVYCLDAAGKILWKRDLRPELSDTTHMYMTPILCDLNGDAELEILAMTSDGYFSDEASRAGKGSAILFALNARGDVLDRFDLGSPRYFGEAFVCQLDDDPHLELVLSGSGGLDVIETRGLGPDTEYFQRRRTYQRLNVLPWAYEDNYFIDRGTKRGVVHRADNLVLSKTAAGHVPNGQFVTSLLALPPGCEFRKLRVDTDTPAGTALRVDVLAADGRLLLASVGPDADLHITQPVRLAFHLSTSDPARTPLLNSYSLHFNHPAK